MNPSYILAPRVQTSSPGSPLNMMAKCPNTIKNERNNPLMELIFNSCERLETVPRGENSVAGEYINRI